MPFAFEKLKGLDRERLLAVIDPILRAHRLEGVELIWRTDQRGWVLYLTVERPDRRVPGAGVTLDDCTELSRDLSTSLDVANVMPSAYRLEVGTPGVERKLYTPQDYSRFCGQNARVKLRAEVEGQRVLRGTLMAPDEDGKVQIDTDQGWFAVAFEQIESGQLLYEAPKSGAKSSKHPQKTPGRRK